MFAIHSPQTVTLRADDGEEATAIVNFSTNGADTSRCKMEITSKGRTWTAVFNTRGYLVDQSYTGPKENPDDPEVAPLTTADFIVDGRDTRSDNPYTHVAPVDADTAYRDGQTPGIKHPIPTGPDGKPVIDEKKVSEDAHKQAAESAKKAREQREKIARETPEERADRLTKEQDAKHERVAAQLEGTPGLVRAPAVEQSGEPPRNADGSVNYAQPEPSRDPNHYDPLVPAASSPLPGSPPPHRVDSANPTNSKVNTTTSMQQPA